MSNDYLQVAQAQSDLAHSLETQASKECGSKRDELLKEASEARAKTRGARIQAMRELGIEI